MTLSLNPEELLSPELRKFYKKYTSKKTRYSNDFSLFYVLRKHFLTLTKNEISLNKLDKINFETLVTKFIDALEKITSGKYPNKELEEYLAEIYKKLFESKEIKATEKLVVHQEKLINGIRKFRDILRKKEKLLKEGLVTITYNPETIKQSSNKKNKKKLSCDLKKLFESFLEVRADNSSINPSQNTILKITVKQKLLNNKKEGKKKLLKFLFRSIYTLLYFLYAYSENPQVLITFLTKRRDSRLGQYLLLLLHYPTANELAWAYFKQHVCKSCIATKQYTLETKREKTFRDPMYGDISFAPDEIAIIDSCFVQRLRRIRQMGFLDFIFPDAVHTRFDHTLGVSYITKKMYETLKKRGLLEKVFDEIINVVLEKYKRFLEFGSELDDETKQKIIRVLIDLEEKVVVYSSILHDVGHVPFSHTGEQFYKILIGNNIDIKDNEKEHPAIYKYTIYIKKPHEGNGFFLIVDKRITLTLSQNLKAIPFTDDPDLRNETTFKNCLNETLRNIFNYIFKSTIERYNSQDLNCDTFTCDELLDFMIARVGLYVIDLKDKDIYSSAKKYLQTIGYPLSDSNPKVNTQNKDLILLLLLFVNKELTENANLYPFHEIINGKWIDADKLDYYFRNAYFSGHEFIIRHRDRILNSLSICKVNDSGWVLSVYGKSIDTAYSLTYNRYFLEKGVHHHPLNLGMEYILNNLLETYKKTCTNINSSLNPLKLIRQVHQEWQELLMCNDVDFVNLLLQKLINSNNINEVISLFELIHRLKLKTFAIIELSYNLKSTGPQDKNPDIKDVFKTLERKIRDNLNKNNINSNSLIFVIEDNAPTISLKQLEKINTFRRSNARQNNILNCNSEDIYLKILRDSEKELTRFFIFINMFELFNSLSNNNDDNNNNKKIINSKLKEIRTCVSNAVAETESEFNNIKLVQRLIKPY